MRWTSWEKLCVIAKKHCWLRWGNCGEEKAKKKRYVFCSNWWSYRWKVLGMVEAKWFEGGNRGNHYDHITGTKQYKYQGKSLIQTRSTECAYHSERGETKACLVSEYK